MWIDLLLSLAQLGLLPAAAFLLDHKRVDARAVMLCGLALVVAACLGSARVDSSWNRDQFYFWQDLQMVGQPMIAVSLLMLATKHGEGARGRPIRFGPNQRNTRSG